ncbi:TIGR04255 family protein [Bradyrhizobium sp. 31Argb]|uniref:TIGR04255 family protein n=1 Tax=Bradyrhizobium sp. 31Argb TaxID=3141247 RepID=UPI003748F874
MSEKMSRAPVYLGLAQVRFNRLLALDGYAPAIQELFRKLGYPDFRKVHAQIFSLNVTGATEGGQGVPAVPLVQYVFSNIERTLCFVLLQDGLTYMATEYDVFETFSERLLEALSIVDQIVGGLSYTDRIGVRYLDAVYPEHGDRLAEYLNPGVMGLVGALEGDLTHSFFETVTRTKNVTLVSRVIVQPGPVGIPADLQPLLLNLPERFQGLDALHATLDNDGFIEARAKYDPARVKSELFLLHDEIGNIFKLTVTDHALKKWK